MHLSQKSPAIVNKDKAPGVALINMRKSCDLGSRNNRSFEIGRSSTKNSQYDSQKKYINSAAQNAQSLYQARLQQSTKKKSTPVQTRYLTSSLTFSNQRKTPLKNNSANPRQLQRVRSISKEKKTLIIDDLGHDIQVQR